MKNLILLFLTINCTSVFAQSDTVISKTIVDPTAMVAGSFGGNMQVSKFKAARKIEVKGPDTSAAVISYTIYFQGKGFEAATGIIENIKGNLFTKDVVRLLAKCAPGSTVSIDNIKVLSGGVTKKVPSLHFILQ